MTTSAFGVEDTRREVIEKKHRPPKRKVHYLSPKEAEARSKRTKNAVGGAIVGTLLAPGIGTAAGAGLGYGLTRRNDRMGSIRGRVRPR